MNINFMRDLLDIYIFPTLTFCELSLPLSPLFSSLPLFPSRLSLHFVSRKVTIHLKLIIKSGYDRSTCDVFIVPIIFWTVPIFQKCPSFGNSSPRKYITPFLPGTLLLNTLVSVSRCLSLKVIS